MGGDIISELGAASSRYRGAQSSRNWGAASSGISKHQLPNQLNMLIIIAELSRKRLKSLRHPANAGVPVAVYTRAPAQSGRRGLEIRKTPVHSTADSLGIPVFTPTSLRDVETQKQFKNQAEDVALVIAYGRLLTFPTTSEPQIPAYP